MDPSHEKDIPHKQQNYLHLVFSKSFLQNVLVEKISRKLSSKGSQEVENVGKWLFWGKMHSYIKRGVFPENAIKIIILFMECVPRGLIRLFSVRDSLAMTPSVYDKTFYWCSRFQSAASKPKSSLTKFVWSTENVKGFSKTGIIESLNNDDATSTFIDVVGNVNVVWWRQLWWLSLSLSLSFQL